MSCTYCYKGFALPGEPKGTMIGQDYFTAAPNDATQQTKAIVLLTDIFGLPLPNPRIVADHLAEQVGVDVWVPDFFKGAPPYHQHDMLALVGWLMSKPAPFRKASCRREYSGTLNGRPCWCQKFMAQCSEIDPQDYHLHSKTYRMSFLCC